MELVIYAPQEGDFLKEISFNNDEIKKELAVRLQKYEGLVYSEANIKEAKTDRATLNKFKDAVESRRKEIKKQVMAPYEAFEVQIKEIVAMVDEPIKAIDDQVKAYEQIKKDEKLEAIKQFYSDKVADLRGLVRFDKIFNPRWLNATYKEADIQKEITDLFIKVEDDLKVITELQSEYELQIKDTYLRNFDLTAALQEKKRLEEQAARLAEHKRQQEEKKRQVQDTQTEVRPPYSVKPVGQIVLTPGAEPENKVFVLDFRVWVTAEQLRTLKQFLVNNDIKYGKVPEERKVI
jgi:hypothetical protein